VDKRAAEILFRDVGPAIALLRRPIVVRALGSSNRCVKADLRC